MHGTHTKIQTDLPFAGFTWTAAAQLRGNGMHGRCISAVSRWVIENRATAAACTAPRAVLSYLARGHPAGTTAGRSCQNIALT